MGTNEDSESVTIGKDIPWGVIYGGYCRVTHFTPFATVEAGKIREFSQLTGVVGLMPYALLSVEMVVDDACPWKTGFLFKPKSLCLPKEASMPVVHRIDFLNLWEIFREIKLSTGEEVLVQYRPLIGPIPRSLLDNSVEEESGKLDIPRLVIGIYTAGSLENMCFPPENTLYPRKDFPKPVAEWDETPDVDFKGDIFGNYRKVFKHNNHP